MTLSNLPLFQSRDSALDALEIARGQLEDFTTLEVLPFHLPPKEEGAQRVDREAA